MTYQNQKRNQKNKMEIERKFLINKLPENLSGYPVDTILQAYISTNPVLRVRQKNEDYILTLKSGGLLAREEIEMPLEKDSFIHLLSKKDGICIEKKRYKIPDGKGNLIELDVFEGDYHGFIMAEVEFPTIAQAEAYQPPAWFGSEVTMDPRFHNSNLSRRTKEEVCEFLHLIREWEEA